MATFKTNPNYNEDSKAFAAQSEEERMKALEEASRILSANAANAARKIASYSTSVENFQDPQSESIKLNASKHILKLVGMEVDRSEVNNKGSIGLVISPEHAQKVLDAAE